MNPVHRLRDSRGPALLSYGFRPFFLFGAIYAGLAILAWLPMFNGELALSTAFGPIDWHVHELLYGYLPAVVTGFLLTAIPNWTGRLPLQGMPLLVLVAVWLGGRARCCRLFRGGRLAGGRNHRRQLSEPGRGRDGARNRRRQ